MVQVKLLFTLHATDWLWGTLCAVCTRRWKRSAIEPSLTRGWRWTEWNSPGRNTVGRCSGWRMYPRNSTQIHRNRWRNSARFVESHLSIKAVTDNICLFHGSDKHGGIYLWNSCSSRGGGTTIVFRVSVGPLLPPVVLFTQPHILAAVNNLLIKVSNGFSVRLSNSFNPIRCNKIMQSGRKKWLQKKSH